MSGLCPYHFVSNSKKIQTAWHEITFSLIVLIIISYLYRTIGIRVIINLNTLLAINTFNLVLCALFIQYIDQCARARAIASHFTDAHDILMEFIQQLNIFEHFNFWKTIGKFIFKIVFGIGINVLSTYYVVSIISETFSGFVDHYAIFMMCIVSSTQIYCIPFIFYAIIVGASIQYGRINQKIQQIMKKAEHINRKRYPNDFMSRSNHRLNTNLKRELDYLADLHGKLTKLIMNINDQFSIPLLFFYTMFITALLIQVI